MNILFFSLGGVHSSLYGLLAKTFAKRGGQITMINPSSDGFCDTESDNIRQITFKALPVSGGSSLRKGLANLLMPFQCKRIVKKLIKKNRFDIILSSTPPVAFYLPIEYIKKRNPQAKHYLILRDIWPEAFNLFDFEKHHPIIYAFFRKQEKRLYATVDIIGCMSEGNIDFVAASNPETQSKLRLLYNWGRAKEKVETDATIREKYGLVGKFVLIYGGNMGVPQGLDNVVDLANMVKDKSDVVFLLIGKGTEKERIKRKVQDLHLTNVRILDFLPKEDYESVLQTCDVGLISLNNMLKTPSIPSKTISYWNLRMPILAIVDHATDYGPSIIDKSESGLWAFADQPEQIKNAFEKLYADSDYRKQLGENGMRFLLEKCTVETACDNIIKQLYE